MNGELEHACAIIRLRLEIPSVEIPQQVANIDCKRCSIGIRDDWNRQILNVAECS